MPSSRPWRPHFEELEPRVVLNAANERFINGLWHDLFGRPVGDDPLGWTAVARLDQGIAPGQAVREVVGSRDFLEKLVADAHVRLLRRFPVPSALNGGISFLARGGRLAQLQAQLLGSARYFRINGGNDAAFVRALYRDVTGRPAGRAVLRTHLRQLRRGMSRQRLAASVLDDPGAVRRQVEDVYRQFLGRDADPDGLNAQGQVLRVGGLPAVLVNLLGSAEYYRRHSPPVGLTQPAGGRPAQPVGINSLSPADGDNLAHLGRETVVRFDGVIDPATVNGDSFFLTAHGVRVPGRIQVSSTGRFATFFPDALLPASTEVRVEIDGDRIRGQDGSFLDADGDGLPGGKRVADFHTVPVTRVAGTNVFGFLRDAYTGQAIVGATVRVEGLPGVTAVTDANGRFELTDMPAPEIFLRIDGSTAVNAPAGRSYASLSRSVQTVAGTTIAVAVDIYLPSVAASDIQPLSPTETTAVGLGPAAREELALLYPTLNPAIWNRTAIEIAPGSAQDAAGASATEAVLVPVPSDHVPVPLPYQLDPGLVFSVETPNATYFDTPATVSFPNLQNLAPGADATFWTFDPDHNMWWPSGPGTVSADGLVVVSQPGTGILTPGFHFVSPPLASLGGGVPTGNLPPDGEAPPAVEVRFLTSGQNDTLTLSFAAPTGASATRVVDIGIEGRYFGEFLDASGALGLRSETITLRPGDATLVRHATLRSVQDILAQANGGRPFDQDVLYGTRITVRETLILLDGSRVDSSRTLFPYLYLDQGDDNPTDGVLAFRDVIADGPFSSSRPYELRLDGAPVPTFVFPGSSSNDWINQQSGGEHALRFDPTAQGERSTQLRIQVNVAGDAFFSPTGPTLRGTGTAGTTIYLNRAAAIAVGQSQGLTEAEAVELYLGIKARLESIIRDLGSNAETRLLVSDAASGQGAGREIAVVWNSAENEFLDKNGDSRPQANEAGDIDGDGVYFETPGEFIDLNRNGRPDAGEFDPSRLLDPNGNGVRDVPGDFLDYNRNGRFDVETLLGRAFTGVDFATDEFGDRLVTNVDSLGALQRAYVFDGLFNRNPQGSFELMLNTIIANGGVTRAEQAVYGGTVVAHEAFHTLGGVHSDNMGIGAFDILHHTVAADNRLTPVSRAVLLAALDLHVDPDDLDMARRAYRRGYKFRHAEPAAFPDALFAVPMHPEGPQFTLLTDAGEPTFEEIAFGTVAADGSGGLLVSVPVRIANTGDEPLILNGISLTHGGRGFGVSGFVLGATIAPGEEIELTLTFDPSVIGAVTDILTFETNATGPSEEDDTLHLDDGEGHHNEDAPPPDGKIRVHLSGRGVDPGPVFRLEVHGGNNNVGGADVGTQTTQAGFLTITNDGATELRFTPTVMAGQGDFNLGNFAAVEHVLAPFASLVIPLTFTPTARGLLPGMIRFTTNDPGLPTVTQGVVGTGVPVDGVGPNDFDWGSDFAVLQFGTEIRRVVTNRAGGFTLEAPVGAFYDFGLFDPMSGLVLRSGGTAGPNADLTTPLAFRASTAPDTDFDGLPDDVEFILGTQHAATDSDGDGLSDFAEVRQGLNPLDGIAAPTGAVGGLNLPGTAHDVTAAGGLLYVATGTHGLAIVDPSEPQNAILLGQLGLPGGVVRGVSVDAARRLAALAGDSLMIVDISDPMTPRLLRTVPGAVDRVEVADGVAYTTSGVTLRAIDLRTGTILQTLTLPGFGSVTALAREGTTLYAYISGDDRLVTVDVAHQGQAAVLGSLRVEIDAPEVGLAVGDGVAWLAGSGLRTVDVSNPASPVLLHGADTIFDARHITLNGSGLALVTLNGMSRVEVYDVRNPLDTDAKVAAFPLPFAGIDAVIRGGLGFVTDGNRLDVVNYRAFDTFGQPPNVTLTATPPDANPSLPGVQVLEGTTLAVRVAANDDVQVSRVELLVNGQVVQEGESFPFDLFAQAPLRAAGKTSVALQVRVTDTGGNSSLSNLLTFPLVEDSAAPTLTMFEPASGHEDLQIVRIRFSEAIDAGAVNAQNFRLRDAAGNILTPLAVESREDDHLVQLTYLPLGRGDYEFVIDGAAVTDRAGNVLAGTPFITTFTLLHRATVGTSALDIDPTTPGIQVEEGTTLPVFVTAAPDVPVAAVEWFVNGQSLGVDSTAPFAFALEAPFNPPGPSTLTFEARVTDAYGFVTLTPPLVVEVREDVTPPTATAAPGAGVTVEPGLTGVRLDFSEPILHDPSTAPPVFQLFEAGSNGTHGDDDDLLVAISGVQLQNGNREVVLTTHALAEGKYQVRVRRDGVRDRAGNLMGTGTFTSEFTVAQGGTLLDELFNRAGTAQTGEVVLDGGTLRVGLSGRGNLLTESPSLGVVFDGRELLGVGDFFANFSIRAGGELFQNSSPAGSRFLDVRLEDISVNGQHAVRFTATVGTLRVRRVVVVSDGGQVALIATRVTNLGGAAIDGVAWMENLNPQQGVGLGQGAATFNDVVEGGRLVLGAATDPVLYPNGLTIGLGTLDARATTSAEAGHLTDSADVLESPSDPQGAPGDIDLHTAFDFGDLLPGQSATGAMLLVVGRSVQDAIDRFNESASLTQPPV